MSTAVTFASVAAGGASGACLRYAVGLALAGAGGRFPWSILLVNVVGCLMAGFFSTWILQREIVSLHWQLFLTTGFLGGFTTFSAFSVDTLRLAESGQGTVAVANVLLNLCGSLAAVGVGWWLARHL